MGTLEGDASTLRDLIDDLLLENDCLSASIASLDVERLRVACAGLGTDDSALIEVLATRSKPHLARVSQGYRHYHGQNLSELVGAELSGWYRYLAQFIVLDTAQSDRLLLDLALPVRCVHDVVLGLLLLLPQLVQLLL